MNKTVIFVVGGLIALLVVSLPFIYGAMKQSDYDALKNGIQDAKRRSGMWIEEDYKNRHVPSYEERYVRGDFDDV